MSEQTFEPGDRVKTARHPSYPGPDLVGTVTTGGHFFMVDLDEGQDYHMVQVARRADEVEPEPPESDTVDSLLTEAAEHAREGSFSSHQKAADLLEIAKARITHERESV